MSRNSSNLDLLRTTAVLLVLMSHLFEVFGLKGEAFLSRWGISDLGHLGVLMFFIHTSLVLMMSLERLSSEGKNVAGKFYVRRVFRIYPLSIFTILAVVALRIPAYFEPAFMVPGPGILASNLLLVQNLTGSPSVVGPLWSLPFEVQMYLLLPGIFLVARRVDSQRGAMLLLASGFVGWWLEEHLARRLHYEALFTYMPWFFMGVASYVISRNVPQRLNASFYPVCLAAFVAAQMFAHRFIGDYRAGWVVWAAGSAFALIVPRFKDVSDKAIRSVAHTIATYSYGIYLLHVPILWFAFQRLHSRPLLIQWSVGGALLVVLPVLLYHVLEAPLIKVGATLSGSASKNL